MQPVSMYKPKPNDYEILRRVYINGGDVVKTGISMGMSSKTARRYLTRIIMNKPVHQRGGSRNTKITPPILNYMIKLVEENNDITLEEIREKILQKFTDLTNLSTSTIWKYLDCRLITTKLIRYVSEEANSPNNLQNRFDYVTFMSNLDREIKQIFVDETNFTILTRRNIGWSRKGERATRATTINGCKKINIIHSVSPDYGNIHTSLEDLNINSDLFDKFIRDLLLKLKEKYPNQKFIIIMDNARIHRPTSLQQIFHEDGFSEFFQLKMLPPLSPFLNPIEHVFSMIKSFVKEYLRNHNDELIATAHLPWGQKGSARFEILKRAVVEGINSVTPQDVSRFAFHCSSFFAQVLQHQPINE